MAAVSRNPDSNSSEAAESGVGRVQMAGGRSILVAEDSKVIRQHLVSILEGLPAVHLRLASDGLEALSMAREKKPDLLICDHEMPGMNGIQLIRVLRGAWSRFELPILMLTSHSETETKVQAFSHGASDYITKPVEPAELRARVMGQLDLHRAVNDNLKARLQLLEARKYQAVGRLAAGMAHELNNPAQCATSNLSYLLKSLNTVGSVVESALDWAQSNPGEPLAIQLLETANRRRLEQTLREAPAAAREALDGVQRMASIIAEMTEFAGDSVEESDMVDVNRAIENTVEVSRSSFGDGIELALKLHPALPPVRAAAAQLKQAIFNLLANAVEAVSGRNRTSKRGKVTIESSVLDGGVQVVVSDDGPGIPFASQDRIFDPFYSTKPVGQGTGQGLFVAYAIIVEQAGGRLSCESRAGHGASFSVWLPAGLPAVR